MTINHDQRSAGQINQWCADSAQSVTFTRQLLHASQGRGVILALLVGVLSAITTAGHACAAGSDEILADRSTAPTDLL